MIIMTDEKKPRIIHRCSQKENIRRINEILVGNGHPEDGLAFQFKVFMKDHTKVVEDIAEIKKNVNEALASSGKAARAIELYKAEVNGVEIGEGKRSVKSKLRFDTIISIIGTLVILIGLVITLHQLKKDNTMTDKKIDDLGVPVIVNPRGQTVPLPSDSKLKMYPKDFVNDTIK